MVEVCEMAVWGRVKSIGRGKQDDGTYVRFVGSGGQVAVFVPDGTVMGNGVLKAGSELTIFYEMEQRGGFVLMRAHEVRDGLLVEIEK